MHKNDSLNSLDVLEATEDLRETDLFAEELQEKFNNSEVSVSSFFTASTTSCICSLSTGCTFSTKSIEVE
jgi:hypothetical protein